MNRIRAAVSALVLSGIVGCEEPAGPPAPPAPPQRPKAASPQAADAVPPQPEPSAPAGIRQKAAVGMGQQGRGYGAGIVATPIKALWAVREQLVLIQIQDGLRVFKAMDSQGRGPKSHEEFVEKIIKANHIRLPDLPSGHRYVYDPAQEELMVEQPLTGREGRPRSRDP